MDSINNELVEKRGTKSIKLGSFFGYLAFFLNIVYGLVFVPWVASSLGEQYGIYSICFSLISLFLIDFGLGTTTNVFISRYRANHSEEDVNKFVSTTFKIFLLLDIVIAFVFAAVYFLIPFFYSNPTEWPTEKITLLRNIFLIVAIYSVFSFPFSILQGIMSAYEKFASNKIIDIISKIAHIVLTSIVLIINANRPSTLVIYFFIISYVASGVVGILLRFLFVRKKIGLKFSILSRFDFGYSKTIFSYSIYTAVIAVCSRLIFTICPVIIGATSSSIASGTFNFISTIEGYIFTFGSIISGLFIAKISREQIKDNSIDRINSLAVKVGKIQLFFIAIVIIGFACCGQEFCSIWLRKNELYNPTEVYYGVLIICLYQIGYVPETIFYSSVLTLKKGVKHLSILYAVRALVNVGLASLLSYFWGALGACIAIFIVRTIGLVIENILYKKILNINLKMFFSKVFVPFLIPFIISLSFGFCLHFGLKFTSISLIIRFCLIGFITVISYLVSVFFFVLPKDIRKSKTKAFLNWVKSSHDNDIAVVNHVFLKKKLFSKIMIGSFSLLLVVFASLPFALKNFGISGKYVFEYEGVVVEELTLNAANRVKYVKYNYSSGQKEVEMEKEYKWNLDLVIVNPDDYPDLLVSNYQLQICDNKWVSYWQYYYVNGYFYSKRVYSEYGNKQIVFSKR